MLPINLRTWPCAGDHMAEPTLPVIDFGAFSGGTDEFRRKTADQVDHACRESGFFYLANHGIATDIIDDAFDAAAQFFIKIGFLRTRDIKLRSGILPD